MRVWTVAALQAAVTVAWMTYVHFQPRLLTQFGFETLAGILGWYLALAGSTLAPLAGDASDRMVRSGGDRFPIVRAGVGLAAASFVGVAVVAQASPESPWRFILPLFVAVWIAGMTVFQAPALAILRDEAGGPLRLRIAPVVMATTLPTALWPWIEPLLVRVGGSVAFLAGGAAVTATAFALGRTAPTVSHDTSGAAASPSSPLVALACGLASAFTVLLAVDAIPGVFGEGRGWFAAGAGLVATAAATGAGRIGERVGAAGAILGSLVVVVLAWWVAPSCAGIVPGVALAVGVGGALALHLTTAVPRALGSRAERAGLGAGLYVGGAMLGSRLVAWLVG